mgnify:CR=1 FL=1
MRLPGRDDAEEHVAQLRQLEGITLVESPAGNTGFSANSNRGIAAAGSDDVVLLNNDVIAMPGWLEQLQYAAYRRERRSMAAGRAARAVAWIAGNVFGDWAVQSGWFARAGTILEEAGEDRPERGWVLIMRAYAEPDPGVREALLGDAVAVGRRFGDPDVEFEALSHLGCLHVMSGRVEQGMLLLDEALAAICADELREVATVDSIMCGLFLGLRAGQRRPPGRPVDARGRRPAAAAQRGRRLLPRP